MLNKIQRRNFELDVMIKLQLGVGDTSDLNPNCLHRRLKGLKTVIFLAQTSTSQLFFALRMPVLDIT